MLNDANLILVRNHTVPKTSFRQPQNRKYAQMTSPSTLQYHTNTDSMLKKRAQGEADCAASWLFILLPPQ
jgi:hypothetical protein